MIAGQRRAVTGRVSRRDDLIRRMPSFGVPRVGMGKNKEEEENKKPQKDSGGNKALQTLAKVGTEAGKFFLGKLFAPGQQEEQRPGQQDPLSGLRQDNMQNAMARFREITGQSPEMVDSSNKVAEVLGIGGITGNQGEFRPTNQQDQAEQTDEQAQRQMEEENMRKSVDSFKESFNKDFSDDNDGSDWFSFGSGDSDGGSGGGSGK